MLTVKWSERQLPSLFAGEIVSHQTEISEEDKDALSIGHRGGRGGVIKRVPGFAPGGPYGSPPLDLAGRPAHA
jgi:hypothetical protein